MVNIDYARDGSWRPITLRHVKSLGDVAWRLRRSGWQVTVYSGGAVEAYLNGRWIVAS